MSLTLYLKSTARLLNPTLSAEDEAHDYATDPEMARSTWGGEFRSDKSQFLPEPYLLRSIMRERASLPPESQFSYASFIDSSGGAHDRFVLAISHKDECSHLVLDWLETVCPPFDFFDVIKRFALIMNSYRTHVATGDNYLAQTLPQAFSRHGIAYQKSDLSKSQIFAQVLPLFSAGLIELLDVQSLHSEFRALERRPRSNSLVGDMIEVPRSGFDDQCNAVAGSLLLAANQTSHRGEYENSVTTALHDHDPYAEPRVIRPAPRRLPAGFGGCAYEPDYSKSIRDHDPFN